jgi:hypothetical protein
MSVRIGSNLLTQQLLLSLNAATLGIVRACMSRMSVRVGTVPSGFGRGEAHHECAGAWHVSNGYQIINRADVGGQYLNEWQTAKATWVTTVCRFNNNPLPKTGY